MSHWSQYARDAQLIRSSGFFLRLARKTQVYSPRETPHIRMRMTHTVDVLGFAQWLASQLPTECLRELDCALAHSGLCGPQTAHTAAYRAEQFHLAAAIALAHDLGHTPFGHAGEGALRQAAPDVGFKHNWQSVRILERVESRTCDYDRERRSGMGLAWEVLDGILNHTRRPQRRTRLTRHYLRDWRANQPAELESNGVPATAAGLAVAVADEVAQRVGDVNDGLRQEAIGRAQLRDKLPALRGLFRRRDRCERRTRAEDRNRDYVFRVELQAELMAHYANAAARLWRHHTACVAAAALAARRAKDTPTYKRRFGCLLGDAMELDGELALMIREQLHEHPKVIEANRIGERVLRDLADACLAEPRLALDWYWSRYQADRAAGSREARYHVIDYVAALTDDHALQRHHELFGTTFD